LIGTGSGGTDAFVLFVVFVCFCFFLPEYHLYQDQLRAIETGLFVIRVSANGYSAIIDPRGRIIKRTELAKQQIFYDELHSL